MAVASTSKLLPDPAAAVTPGLTNVQLKALLADWAGKKISLAQASEYLNHAYNGLPLSHLEAQLKQLGYSTTQITGLTQYWRRGTIPGDVALPVGLAILGAGVGGLLGGALGAGADAAAGVDTAAAGADAAAGGTTAAGAGAAAAGGGAGSLVTSAAKTAASDVAKDVGKTLASKSGLTAAGLLAGWLDPHGLKRILEFVGGLLLAWLGIRQLMSAAGANLKPGLGIG